MKAYFITVLISAACSLSVQADATVRLNNYDMFKPIYLLDTSTLAPLETHVELLYKLPGDVPLPVTIAGTTISTFQLNEPGYFDAGIGVIPNLDGNQTVTFELHAWLGSTYPGNAPWNSSVYWTQTTQSWDPASGVPTTGEILIIPTSIVFMGVPEPKTYSLGIFAAALIFATKSRKAITFE